MLQRLRWLDSIPGPERYVGWLLVAAYVVLAAFIGLIVSTGNVMMVALTVGAGMGLLLLGMPVATITAVIVGVLVLSGPLVYHVQALARLPWLFSVLGLILTGSAIVYAGLGRPDGRRPVPGFMVMGACFFAYAAASALWADQPVPDAVQGIKRYLQYWGLFFALAVVAIRPRTVHRWAQLLLAIALIQFLMALYQRLILIPSLSWTPIDAVVGTLELSQIGTGASGILALMQVCCIAALLCLYRERLIDGKRLCAGIVLAGLPLVLGETNILFVWMPLALLAVYLDRALDKPVAFLLAATVIGTALVAFSSAYLVWQQTGDDTLSPMDRAQIIFEYNLGESGYHSKTDLNRKTALEYWWQHHGGVDPVATVFGHGIGGSFSSFDMRGWVSEQHGGRHIDLVAVSSILWDLGVIGLLLFAGTFALAAGRAYRLSTLAANGIDRAMARSAFVAIVLIASSFFYNNAIVQMPSQQVFSFMILGFVAWLDRRQPRGHRRTRRDRPPAAWAPRSATRAPWSRARDRSGP